MQLDIVLTESDRQEIARRLLGTKDEPSPTDIDHVITSFVQLAVNECCDWILGRNRYRTLSELQIERIGGIFSTILPTEIPRATRLYNDFALSYGQASYVARVLADRDLSTWRDKAREELGNRIKRKLDLARNNCQPKDSRKAEPTKPVTLELTKLAYRELILTIEQAFLADEYIAPPKRQNTAGDINYVEIESQTLLTIAKTLGL